MKPSFKICSTQQEFEIAKILFEEYAASLNVDLCFQGFKEELQTIDIQYNLPKGCLYLVYNGHMVIGCAAVREFENKTGELKRMYLKPECRGYKVGQKLLEIMISKTQELGYTKLRLDTLPQMKEALQLYRKFGFTEIASYRFNPVQGTVYMEKELYH
jgi:putative acetyltransferase